MDGDERASDGKQQKGNFLGQNLEHNGKKMGRAALGTETSEGPIVEKQKGARQGDDHGLGHETQDKEQNYREIAGDGGFAHIPAVSGQCQEEKSSTEKSFAFGDPGDGLDV